MNKSIHSQTVIDYQQSNQWLQKWAKQAGAGQSFYPVKPTVNDAQEIIQSFLSYQELTTGVLKKFRDHYLQFETTQRPFSTEHAMTQAIMEDSSSRAISMHAPQNMVAFVSTSAQAVSSDARFLRITMDALESMDLNHAFAPDFSESIQTGQTREQQFKIKAEASVSTSFLSFFKASAHSSAQVQSQQQTVRQGLSMGKTHVDAMDRRVLTCLSAIYGMEASGVLPEGRFMHTFIRLSEIAAEKTQDNQTNLDKAQSLLTTPSLSLGSVNEAMKMNAQIRQFLLPFCADQLQSALHKQPEDRNAVEFWSEVHGTVKSKQMDASRIKMFRRYVDHQDVPEPNMVLALMEMSDMLSKTRKQAESLLLSDYHGQMYSNDYAESTLNFDDRIQSVYLSPLIGPENALVVKINSDNGLTPCLTALKEIETLFTEFTLVLTDSQHQRVIRNDQWDNALQIADQINHALMSNTAEGFVSVIKEDTLNHQWCLVREPIDEDGPLLHGMSPYC